MSTAEEQITIKSLTQWFQSLDMNKHRSSRRKYDNHRTPRTTSTRLIQSLDDKPFDTSALACIAEQNISASEKTVLYLAYGSNLCRETFQEKRGIRPVSQVNVVVPQLVMTFDLPGLPYSEPCFANTKYRQVAAPDDGSPSIVAKEGYHKDAWYKGLVGVVYEVTLADYVHIIATEGGGASYQDVLVDCYGLPDDPRVSVPLTPSGTSFKAHTLFAPAALASKGGRLTRPDPAYAQPSPRYLKLITDGADELTLPVEYREYLHAIRGYRITNNKQRLGQFIFLSIWRPLIEFVFGAGRLFADKNGRYPPWLTTLAASVFLGMWTSYDGFFKGLFGEGERTIEDESSHHLMDEKQPLLLVSPQRKYEDVPAGNVLSADAIV